MKEEKMQYNKFQSGRPMLEMLAVLSIGVALVIFSILLFRRSMDNYKASAVLDYVNSVYAIVRQKSSDDKSLDYLKDGQGVIACEKIVPGKPSTISSCSVTHVCGCGSNTELGVCNKTCTTSICNYRRSSPKACVATVTFVLGKGEKNTATTLEGRVGLELREEMSDSAERVFMKANCLGDLPQECANGYARCTYATSHCSDVARTK